MAFDTTPFVEISLEEVLHTLVEAIILVVLVIFVFLQDWRTTIIPTVAIPVSLVGTCAALLVLGFERTPSKSEIIDGDSYAMQLLDYAAFPELLAFSVCR